MVGVPGRSKGCRTCRRRKKGCDKAEPSCNQCLAAGLICEGYGRELVWVNATAEEEPTGRQRRPVANPSEPWQVRYAGQPGTNIDVILRDSLAKTAREQKYLGMFWSAYLPNGRAFTSRGCKLSTGGWTSHMGKLYDAEPTLRLASLAMSASVIGHQNNDSQLVIKGLKAYSEAIQEMGRAVACNSRRVGDGLLAASRLMEFYEILFGNDSGIYPDATMHVHGWRGHNDGQMSLVLTRGASNLQSGTGHQLFADGRLNMVVGDIAKRRRSRLAEPVWKSVPWQRQEKSVKDKLLDILMDIPGLLEDLDVVKSIEDPPSKEIMRQRVLFACKRCHGQLTVWEDEVGADLLVYDYIASGLPLPAPKTDIDTALLQITSLYWVVGILLYSTIGLLKREGPPVQTPPPQDTQPSYLSPPASVSSGASSGRPSPPPPVTSHTDDGRRNPKLCAYKIAHSVHLFWEPAAGAFGNHIGLFPLGVAMRFLASIEPIETSDPYQMMRQLFRRPFLGTQIGTFLSNLQKEAPREDLRKMAGDAGIQARAQAWWNRSEQRLQKEPQ
ncbi:hypothetical protein NLG97_g605 [Lecanicillium saksenae]|uniref:Uncharacterized protein n=1 Tax=Lecanicillium saksenae TaxID=468837 RepID=A0ACC1R6A1_9HYPO|nr:hypothetical protein NLG97_g605 [Lecanicillium saksenae]